MFWTCDATCKANRQLYEEKRRVFNDLNKDYLKGVAEVRNASGCQFRLYSPPLACVWEVQVQVPCLFCFVLNPAI